MCAGADAIYTGGVKFGARAYADNPEEEELLRLIDYAHLHGRKIYMTVNTLLKHSCLFLFILHLCLQLDDLHLELLILFFELVQRLIRIFRKFGI